MNEFENNNFEENNEIGEQATEENVNQFSEEATQPAAEDIFIENEGLFPPVNYSNIEPVRDYTPMSKGLKVFALAMAAVILLTAVCIGGYSMGRNGIGGSNKSEVIGLEAKPKDTDELTAAQIYEQVSSSVVGIYVYNTEGDAAQASGVIYSKDGYVITNDHIYSEISSPKFKVYTADGKEYSAEYVAGDTISDLAVLKISSGSFTPAVLGDSDQLIYGENVVAIGRPNAASEDSSITKGIISALSHRVQTTSSYSASLIQTDSAINPGSSGGALVNMYGQVVGITSSKLAGIQYDSVGYAIPTVTVKQIVEELINYGKVTTRAKLGISYTEINSVTAEITGSSYVGLQVAAVNEDSDLYGKIVEGDIITHVNGIQVTNDDIVLDIIEQSKAGDTITITAVSQNGISNDYTVKLKANVGQSSYTTEEIPSSSNDSNSGGTFDFPFGE